MSHPLIQYLVCTTCKESLNDHITSLICQRCLKQYKISSDIPIMIALDDLPSHLQGQVTYFEKDDAKRTDYKLNAWQQSYLRRLSENFSYVEGQVVVDVGCGSGYITIAMARLGLQVIACDLTFQELLSLQVVLKHEGLLDKVLLVCCSAEDLPVKSNIADHAISNAVLEHLPRDKDAMKEMSRVSKDKSSLMVNVPLRSKYVWPIFWLPNYLHDKKIGHLRKYDEPGLVNAFQYYGYHHKQTYYTGHFMKSVIYMLTKLGLSSQFMDRLAEYFDDKCEHRRYGAINITICMERK